MKRVQIDHNINDSVLTIMVINGNIVEYSAEIGRSNLARWIKHFKRQWRI